MIHQTDNEIIDIFYVIDFDRCLGNVDASFNLLKDVIDSFHIGNRHILQLARSDAEAKGISFSVFEYIKEHHHEIDLNVVEKLYLERDIDQNGSLLEPGAVEFLNFLKSTNLMFCIMSYGDKRWQMLKMEAAGLKDIPKVIVPSNQKGKYIAQWFNRLSNRFVIPEEYFVDGKTRESKEVVLVEDKINAFNIFPPKARGYLIIGNSGTLDAATKSLPSSVKLVSSIDKIIEFEKRLV